MPPCSGGQLQGCWAHKGQCCIGCTVAGQVLGGVGDRDGNGRRSPRPCTRLLLISMLETPRTSTDHSRRFWATYQSSVTLPKNCYRGSTSSRRIRGARPLNLGLQSGGGTESAGPEKFVMSLA